MNFQQPANTVNFNKRQRRSRNEIEGRDFQCKCGRSQASYPALYQHIKTKHNVEGDNIDSYLASNYDEMYDEPQNYAPTPNHQQQQFMQNMRLQSSTFMQQPVKQDDSLNIRDNDNNLTTKVNYNNIQDEPEDKEDEIKVTLEGMRTMVQNRVQFYCSHQSRKDQFQRYYENLQRQPQVRKNDQEIKVTLSEQPLESFKPPVPIYKPGNWNNIQPTVSIQNSNQIYNANIGYNKMDPKPLKNQTVYAHNKNQSSFNQYNKNPNKTGIINVQNQGTNRNPLDLKNDQSLNLQTEGNANQVNTPNYIQNPMQNQTEHNPYLNHPSSNTMSLPQNQDGSETIQYQDEAIRKDDDWGTRYWKRLGVFYRNSYETHGPLDDFPRYNDSKNVCYHPLWYVCKNVIQKGGFDMAIWSNEPSKTESKNEIDWMFAKQILNQFPVLKKKFYKNLLGFICQFRETINKQGWLFLEKNYPQFYYPIVNKQRNNKFPEFSRINPCEFVPELTNQFVADYDPEKVKIEKGLVILLVEHLCKWLQECGGTGARLAREQFNDQFPDDSEDEEVEDSEAEEGQTREQGGAQVKHETDMQDDVFDGDQIMDDDDNYDYNDNEDDLDV